jgi:hypothetical protein
VGDISAHRSIILKKDLKLRVFLFDLSDLGGRFLKMRISRFRKILILSHYLTIVSSISLPHISGFFLVD